MTAPKGGALCHDAEEYAAPRKAFGEDMRQKALPIALLAVLLPACVTDGPSPGEKPGGAAPGSLLVRSVDAAGSGGPVVFPPPDGGRLARAALGEGPAARAEEHRAPEVTVPWVQEGIPVNILGNRIRFVFNQAMARPGEKPQGRVAAAPGALTLTPAVKGHVDWLDAYTLEFVAEEPMRIGERHEIVLGDVRSLAGNVRAAAWRAHAVPRAVVAGKVLGHAPKAGEPRVVAMSPPDGATVGPRPEIAILYDQPVDLPRAQALVHVEAEDGSRVPMALSHPLGPTFQGVPVDPRFVVIARTPPLGRGQELTLRSMPAFAKDAGASASFSVARPLAVTKVECPDEGDDDCSADGTSLWTEGSGLDFHVNNPISMKAEELTRLVKVSPKVNHLSVRGSPWADGVIRVRGAFEPGKRYDITLVGLTDEYGSRLEQPVRASLERAPRDASITMASGVLLLDEARMKRFEVTTMNVEQAELQLWPVEDDRLGAAVRSVHAGARPGDAPKLTVPVAIEVRDDELVTTPVDLGKVLDARQRYVVAARVTRAIEGADMPGEDDRSPIALVVPGSAESLAVHAEKVASRTLVHVARLGSGEAVPGARIALLDASEHEGAPWVSGADGLARLPGDVSGWLSVSSGGTRTLLDLRSADTTARKLFPALSSGHEIAAGAPRAVLFTDRGIYRPGATVNFFASVRRPEGGKLAPVADSRVVAIAVGPSGEEVFRAPLTTNDLGSVSASFDLSGTAKLGRHRLVIDAAGDETLADAIVQVAEVETPRFTVDVDAAATDGRALRASVAARYLFGAAMGGAAVKWTARREAAPIAEGPFAGSGVSFRPAREVWDDGARASSWSRSGEATVGSDGVAKIEQALSLAGTVGPQRFVVEAEVTDASHRAIAGRGSAVVHSAERYGGVRVARRWVTPGEKLAVQLAVVDREGHAVTGAPVSAALSRIEYTEIARRDAGGELTYEWSRRATPAGRCSAKSAATPVECALILPSAGDYEIAAEVDGRPGGRASVWAFRDGGDDDGPHLPGRGRALPIVTDKATYAAGDTAKLFVTSPFASATAIVTTDAPDATPRTQRIDGSAGVIEVPVSAADAPHLHAMVTLLPLTPSRAEHAGRGGAVADYRFGAVRLPVSASASRLQVEVTPSKPEYRPRDQAEIAILVKDATGAPAAGAEIALAVVDEGVLRLTGYHAPDPVTELRPGRALSVDLFDTRAALADLVSQSHVAGDGDSPGTRLGRRGDTERSVTKARKDFAETAFWGPHMRTDAEGRVTARFVLPDNLTEYRVMAVALDREGKGAVTEASFHVTKPVLLAPALPRFVSLDDRFEAATLVHNNTGAPVLVKVGLDGRVRRLLVPAHGHVRVTFPVLVTCDAAGDGDGDGDGNDDGDDDGDGDDNGNGNGNGDGSGNDDGDQAKDLIRACPTSKDGERAAIRLRFDVEGHDGASLDAVETAIPATFAGLDEQPRVEGAFVKDRTIALAVPARVAARGAEDRIVITLGAQTWPELGDRLRFLLDYPHGCVEQTTSSTLPLLAARDIAPHIGMEGVTEADLSKKILAGIERLGTMRTAGGGLAYWPGGSEPNVYGTAYAIRALVLAKQAGIEPPAALLDGMASYLAEQMASPQLEPEVKSAIAQSLAELGKLDPGAADALHDRRESQSVFGIASLALALSALPGQEDRVAALLDRVEAGIDEAGELREAPRSSDFHYYGSPVRTKAQAAIALRRLRPASPALPHLVRSLASATGSYTTQATAFSLLALAEEVRRIEPGASDATVLLDGRPVQVAKELPGGGQQLEIPLADVAGKDATLSLSSASGKAIAFAVRAAWRRPAAEVSPEAFRTARGPAVYRLYTDAEGGPVDLTKVRPGDVLRVALVVRRPTSVDAMRFGYVAITDRLPAGFEPVQQDLATVAAQPELGDSHPFAAWLRYADERPSHLELHDDRVNVYFDSATGDDVAATYLVRATTPGRFAIPPATAELMYEPDSLGATEPAKVVVR